MAFGVDMRVKNLFFDLPEVIRRMDENNRKALSLAGRDLRQAARGLLGKPSKRGKARPPGKPPRTHSQNERLSLRNILYGLSSKDTLIVGPVRLNQKQFYGGSMGSGTIPRLHEFGGTAGIRERFVGGEWRSMGKGRARPGVPVRVRKARYPARPFMRPALERVSKRKGFAKFWAGGGGAVVSSGNAYEDAIDNREQFPELWS